MLKIVILVSMLMGVTLAAVDPCIINEGEAWAKTMVQQMTEAVNKEEKARSQVMTYIQIINTMGDMDHCLAYLQFYNQDHVKWSCTIQTTDDGTHTHKYVMGEVKCHKSD
ncbi:unnamed protein product [Oppiella nova]|uniref:Uncharacterized protein n=1 Tax=Oppiella nova TaxID=334625 RepID=A0A7R9MBN7_9ACAR|nr:unnamed protein product [Oppiella nova]CAG2173334.1 unnamed protein product [Oppiella nova]